MDRSYHCGVLGVSFYATHEEIKSAYRKLIKKHHPDVDKTDPQGEKLKKINISYNWLLKDKTHKPKSDTDSTTIKLYRTLGDGLWHSFYIPYYSPLTQNFIIFCLWNGKEFKLNLKIGDILPKRIEMFDGKTQLTIEIHQEGNRHL